MALPAMTDETPAIARTAPGMRLVARLGLALAACIVGATLVSCGSTEAKPPEQDTSAEPKVRTERVTIRDRAFDLEVVYRNATRERGLGGRESIKDDGGMLFVFPQAQALSFVMRDCLVDIDIIFLDMVGRVTATYTMPVEDPQREGESREDYERRLKRYFSNRASQFVIELKGGTLKTFEPRIEVNEVINLDLTKLKRLAAEGVTLDRAEANRRGG